MIPYFNAKIHFKKGDLPFKVGPQDGQVGGFITPISLCFMVRKQHQILAKLVGKNNSNFSLVYGSYMLL